MQNKIIFKMIKKFICVRHVPREEKATNRIIDSPLYAIHPLMIKKKTFVFYHAHSSTMKKKIKKNYLINFNICNNDQYLEKIYVWGLLI